MNEFTGQRLGDFKVRLPVLPGAGRPDRPPLGGPRRPEAIVPPIPDWRGGRYRDLLKFNAGQIGAAELVAKAGTSRFNQCEGYLYIGLHKLYKRKRVEAKAWFQKSVDTGVYVYGEDVFSREFLANIDDPNWLPWAVEKKQAGSE